MKNVPKVRFKGFTDEWEEKKLGEIAEVRGGYAFKSKDFSNSVEKYQVIKMGNIYQNNLLLDRYPSFKASISEKEKEYLLRSGDIVITLAGTVGKRDFGYSYQIEDEENLLLNQRVGLIRTKNDVANSKFVRNIILKNHFLNQFFESSVGGTGNQANVSTKNIEHFTMRIPALKEQKRIAEFLTKVDKLIDKQDEKVKELEKYKKGMMQRIFSQEVRFKNDQGGEFPEWEEKKLGDLDVKLIRGPFGSSLKKECMVPKSNDTYKIYEQKNAINMDHKIGNYYVTKEKFKELKRFEVKPGDLIMSCSGTIGRIYEIPQEAERGIVNQALLKIEVSKYLNKEYFIYCFKDNLGNLETKGSGIKNLTSVKFLKEEFFFENSMLRRTK